MANPRLQRTVINGVDVSSYVLSWKIEQEFGDDFRLAKIELKKTVNSIISYGDGSLQEKNVTIQRGVSSSTETYVFRGVVKRVEVNGPYIDVTCEDKLADTKDSTVVESFDYNNSVEAGVISEIFKTLINDYTDLTADNSSVQNSGTVFIRKKFVLRRRTVYDAIKELAEYLDWQFYYEPVTDKVFFEPKGYITESTVFEIGSNVLTVPKWNIDTSSFFNKIIVKGVQQEAVTEEGAYILDGVAQSDWTTTSITLDNKPVQVKVFSDTSNPPTTEKKAGQEGATSSFDYYVDTEDKKVIWSDTFNPTTSYYALVQYSYMIPTPVIRKNSASITEFEKTVEKSVFKDELKNVDDVASWAQKQVNTYGFPFYSTSLRLKGEENLRIGRVYRVIDRFNDIDRELMIQKIETLYPYKGDVVRVADKEMRTSDWSANPNQRLKRLEEKQSDNEDILNDFVDVETDVVVRSIHEIYTASPKSNVLYWGSATQGTWGDFNWGDGTAETETLSQRTHPNNVYAEDYYDDDLVDTGNTTATVNTSAHSISFTTGETFRSNPIFLYKTTTITKATLSIPSTQITGSANLSFYLSADGGSNWESVTLGTQHTFTNTGSDLRIRIDASDTASIVFNDSFEATKPLRLEVSS